MAKINDNIFMMIAVAVTSIICMTGMYLIFGDNDQRSDLNVICADAIELSSFEEYENNTGTNVNISYIEDPDPLLLAGSVRVVITCSDMSSYLSFNADSMEMKNSDSMFIFFKKDDAAAKFFVNWLCKV